MTNTIGEFCSRRSVKVIFGTLIVTIVLWLVYIILNAINPLQPERYYNDSGLVALTETDLVFLLFGKRVGFLGYLLPLAISILFLTLLLIKCRIILPQILTVSLMNFFISIGMLSVSIWGGTLNFSVLIGLAITQLVLVITSRNSDFRVVSITSFSSVIIPFSIVEVYIHNSFLNSVFSRGLIGTLGFGSILWTSSIFAMLFVNVLLLLPIPQLSIQEAYSIDAWTTLFKTGWKWTHQQSPTVKMLLLAVLLVSTTSISLGVSLEPISKISKVSSNSAILSIQPYGQYLLVTTSDEIALLSIDGLDTRYSIEMNHTVSDTTSPDTSKGSFWSRLEDFYICINFGTPYVGRIHPYDNSEFGLNTAEYFNESQFSLNQISSNISGQIINIELSDDGDFLFGWGGGSYTYALEEGRTAMLLYETRTNDSSEIFAPTWQITEMASRNQIAVFGTVGDGLWIYNMNNNSWHRPFGHLGKESTVFDLCFDSSGSTLYAATSTGLLVFEITETNCTLVDTLSPLDGFPSEYITSLFFDDTTNQLLVASTKGICIYNPGTESISLLEDTASLVTEYSSVSSLYAAWSHGTYRIFMLFGGEGSNLYRGELFVISVNYGLMNRSIWHLLEIIQQNLIAIVVAVVSSTIILFVTLKLDRRNKFDDDSSIHCC